MEIESLAGLVLIAGTIIVYIGFSIFPSRIYTATDLDLKVSLVDTYPGRWTISQSLVILGSAVSVVGLALVTGWMQGRYDTPMTLVGLAAVTIGGVLWIWHLTMRIHNPERFARGESLFWPFLAYSILTPAGLAAYGIAFWLGGVDAILGIGMLASAVIVLGLEYILKDLPPFVHYAMTLAIGLTLFI